MQSADFSFLQKPPEIALRSQVGIARSVANYFWVDDSTYCERLDTRDENNSLLNKHQECLSG